MSQRTGRATSPYRWTRASRLNAGYFSFRLGPLGNIPRSTPIVEAVPQARLSLLFAYELKAETW